MKVMLAGLLTVLLSIGIAACGGSGRETMAVPTSSSNSPNGSQAGTASSSMPAGGYLKDDEDKDSDDVAHVGKLPDDDDDRNLLASYGGEVGEAEKRAVASVVKSYFAAAAADHGAKACALLDMTLAKGLGEGPGQSEQGGDSGCAAQVSHLLAEVHQQLVADEVATMVITGVHAKGDLGLALLGFRKAPEGEILIEHEDRAWRIGSLLDSEIP